MLVRPTTCAGRLAAIEVQAQNRISENTVSTSNCCDRESTTKASVMSGFQEAPGSNVGVDLRGLLAEESIGCCRRARDAGTVGAFAA
jgi:hypothetical protein